MSDQINRALLERLRFVDFLLDHFGVVQRKHLMDCFGISEPQASLDLRRYQELAPTNMQYDLKGRTYRKSEVYVRVLP
jgi:hypothetical protein